MYRTRLVLVALATISSMGVALAVASPAQADTKWSECRAGGDILTGWTEFDFGTQNTIYVHRAGFNIERNGGTHNNVYLKLRGNEGESTYWSWISEDDIVGGRSYERKKINTRVPRGAKPIMKYHATFDQRGADPSCAAYGHLGW